MPRKIQYIRVITRNMESHDCTAFAVKVSLTCSLWGREFVFNWCPPADAVCSSLRGSYYLLIACRCRLAPACLHCKHPHTPAIQDINRTSLRNFKYWVEHRHNFVVQPKVFPQVVDFLNLANQPIKVSSWILGSSRTHIRPVWFIYMRSVELRQKAFTFNICLEGPPKYSKERFLCWSWLLRCMTSQHGLHREQTVNPRSAVR